ncbi:MAG TPA: Ig-like domain-containing protein [Gemmatimonadaceae bacterium]|nr:Ig-like domain-containing protein [Gemmatimonadaceae bacterium]
MAVTPATTTLTPGDTVRLTATAKDSAGHPLTDRAISWSSSDTNVVIVDSTGLVTARAQGTVTITAAAEEHTGKATLTVNATPVAQVVVSPSSGMVILGNALQLAATVIDARGDTLTDRPITWASSDTTIATVDSAGFVTPHFADTVTITATAGGQSGTFALRVVLRFAQLDDGSNRPSASLHTCGMTTTGAVYCWGQNASGVLGDGTTTNRSAPVATPGAPTFAHLVAGNDYACALDPSGRTYCWGANSYGQLGDGMFAPHAVPEAAAGNLSFIKLFAGESYVCALTSGGAAYCWGRNTRFETGAGTGATVSTPTAVAGNPTLGTAAFEDLTLGGETSCGLTASGAAYCWGDGMHGQLGNGVAAIYQFQVPVAGHYTFSQLSTSGQHSCGVTTSGSAYCWGWNNHGQLGIGATADSALTPALVAGNHTFARVIAAQGFTCGLTPAGAAYCWGNNSSGQLGNGTIGGSSRVPVAVAGGLTFSSLDMFSSDSLHSHVCGLTTSGVAYCWGDNQHGQLGDGTTTTRGAPAAASGDLTFVQLQVGFERACGLTSAHIAYCWGGNSDGQLGDGTNTDRYTPTPVATQQ